jgi:hypothetical protein
MDIDDFWEAIEGYSGSSPDDAESQQELLEECLEEVEIDFPEPDEDWEDSPSHTMVVCVCDFDARVEILMVPQGESEDDLAMMDCLHVSAADLAGEEPDAYAAALRLQSKLGFLTTDPERIQRTLDGIQGICEAHGVEVSLPEADDLVQTSSQWASHSVGSYDADEDEWVNDECNADLLAKRIGNVVVFRIKDDWG